MFGIKFASPLLRKPSRRPRKVVRYVPAVHELEHRLALSSFNAFALPTPSRVGELTAGPDGNLWFTEYNANQIGRINADGSISEFAPQHPPTRLIAPFGITAGPDGNLWFTEDESDRIGRITPEGTITDFPTAVASVRRAITAGPDGNVWFTDTFDMEHHQMIGRITPDGQITEFPVRDFAFYQNFSADALTTGPDGNLWFTEALANSVARITPDGQVTEFPVPIQFPTTITAGPDGNLWFSGGADFGRITPDGRITTFARPPGFADVVDLTAGPDGNVWFAASDSNGGPNEIGYITPDGNITTFPTPIGISANIISAKIITGPDGNVWFTERGTDNIWQFAPGNGESGRAAGTAALARPARTINPTDSDAFFAGARPEPASSIAVNQQPALPAVDAVLAAGPPKAATVLTGSQLPVEAGSLFYLHQGNRIAMHDIAGPTDALTEAL